MSLSAIVGEGIVLDIDETLSNTVEYLVSGLMKEFGGPEGFSVEQIIRKYKYTWNVECWQNEGPLDWVREACSSNDKIVVLPPIEDAVKYVNKIHDIIPIVGYVTCRPECVMDGTKEWLAKYGFPDAPVVCRPKSVPGPNMNEWKADVLKKLYPKVKGIVDDSVGIIEHLGDYKGTVFFYNNKSSKMGIACADWETVYEEVKKRFN